jgi:hypothetical protein
MVVLVAVALVEVAVTCRAATPLHSEPNELVIVIVLLLLLNVMVIVTILIDVEYVYPLG